MNVIREAVRAILIETMRTIDEPALIAVAEYVGANEPFSLAEHEASIRPFLKRYNKLYRVWLAHDPTVDIATLDAEATTRECLSATKDLESLKGMSERNDWDLEEAAITSFAAEGFDPYEFIREGMRQHPTHPEMMFLRGVLRENEYQREVVVTRILGAHVKVEDV